MEAKQLRRPWTKEEDALLVNCIEKYKDDLHSHWTDIARQTDGRNSKQCRDRYLHHLAAGTDKTPYLPSEERALFALQAELGNKWAEIARRLPGRTESSVKNRYYSALRRVQRACCGSNEDASSLLAAFAGSQAVQAVRARGARESHRGARPSREAAVLPRRSQFEDDLLRAIETGIASRTGACTDESETAQRVSAGLAAEWREMIESAGGVNCAALCAVEGGEEGGDAGATASAAQAQSQGKRRGKRAHVQATSIPSPSARPVLARTPLPLPCGIWDSMDRSLSPASYADVECEAEGPGEGSTTTLEASMEYHYEWARAALTASPSSSMGGLLSSLRPSPVSWHACAGKRVKLPTLDRIVALPSLPSSLSSSAFPAPSMSPPPTVLVPTVLAYGQKRGRERGRSVDSDTSEEADREGGQGYGGVDAGATMYGCAYADGDTVTSDSELSYGRTQIGPYIAAPQGPWAGGMPFKRAASAVAASLKASGLSAGQAVVPTPVRFSSGTGASSLGPGLPVPSRLAAPMACTVGAHNPFAIPLTLMLTPPRARAGDGLTPAPGPVVSTLQRPGGGSGRVTYEFYEQDTYSVDADMDAAKQEDSNRGPDEVTWLQMLAAAADR